MGFVTKVVLYLPNICKKKMSNFLPILKKSKSSPEYITLLSLTHLLSPYRIHSLIHLSPTYSNDYEYTRKSSDIYESIVFIIINKSQLFIISDTTQKYSQYDKQLILKTPKNK